MSAVARWLTRRRARGVLVAALVGVAAGVSAAPALAVPLKWTITMEHRNPYGLREGECPSKKAEPTAIPPCGVEPHILSGTSFVRESGENRYTIKLTNPGATVPAETVNVVDNLPPGMVLANDEPSLRVQGAGWLCKVLTGATGAECKYLPELKIGEDPGPIELRVHVTSEAENPSTNKVTVSGGEPALAPGTGEDKTPVTPAIPFGVTCFAAVILEESQAEPHPCEEPEQLQQEIPAGSHPFSQGAEIVMNSTTSSGIDGGTVIAGGAVKELSVELPPGFVGNPANVPQCPLELLRGVTESRCPQNTAVGTNEVTLESKIAGGKVNQFPAGGAGLVYNMEPPPGHPAAFGFIIGSGAPFLLEVDVRNGRDYGVIVGDKAVGLKPFAFRTTICEFGAHRTLQGAVCTKKSEVSPGSKPFLVNPTACESEAPKWILKTNPWEEQGNVLRVPAKVSPKVVKCNELAFNPELAFKPSLPEFKPGSAVNEGGTSQADEPTGMTFDLKVPQTEEATAKATPALKNLVMTLPAGMTVSPSASNGLQACSNAQFWPTEKQEQEEKTGTPAPQTAEEEAAAKSREPAASAKCPGASQIGTVEVFTPLLSGAPTIEGERHEFAALKCSRGMWSRGTSNASQQELDAEKLSFTYQWLREGVPIEKATGNAFPATYVAAAADVGKAVQCQVTATNEAGSSVAVSRAAVIAANNGPEPAAPPTPPSSIAAPSGTASPGNALTCKSGSWAGVEPEFAYQWLRNGVPIKGATAATYPVVTEDEGKTLQCQVEAKNKGGAGGVAVADSAAVVVSPTPRLSPPLPGGAVQGQLFVGEPECGTARYPDPCSDKYAEGKGGSSGEGSLFRLLLLLQDPRDGILIKLHGTTIADPTTGQLKTVFVNQPQQPFDLLHLKLKGGPGAPLANPQKCGPATTSATATPWSSPETPDKLLESKFEVDWNGAGGACPGASPFSPSFNAGTTSTKAGAFSQFAVTITREDREQNLQGVQVSQPPGLSAMIASVQQCDEASANAGTCPAASQIGTATTGAGPGEHPLFVKGKVYLTGAYKGAPFGLSIVVPAVAGPFNLGNVVVRSAISVDRRTAAATVTSDPLPQKLDGVPFRLRKVYVNVDRPGFIFNPTNCSPQQVTGTLSSAEGTSEQVSSPFGIAGCGSLPFSPTFKASTEAKTSKANGASLTVKITSAPGQANIGKTFLILPRSLPSRLTTIQKACRGPVFAVNPAACPEGSVIGMAIAHSPVLKSPLTGPAYLVSHGTAAFPDVVFLLQGEGVLLELDGLTNIKNGVTSSSFEAVPDAPVSTFETVLPEGPHSALTALGDLCTQALEMPTTITGQNGAVIQQNTKIAVTGCAAAKLSVKIKKAKFTGNGLLVTVTTGTSGTVWVSGFGLKTTSKKLSAGTHQISVRFTKVGRLMHKQHKKTSVRVKLVVGKQAVTKATAARM
jgi:uncharacterized repeat protein (TIGR01451 family)